MLFANLRGVQPVFQRLHQRGAFLRPLLGPSNETTAGLPRGSRRHQRQHSIDIDQDLANCRNPNTALAYFVFSLQALQH